jgi:hypothetical protein
MCPAHFLPPLMCASILTQHAATQGLLRMVVGDHVRIIASPDLCYGSKGFYPLIPANSALIIQVRRGRQPARMLSLLALAIRAACV